MTKVLISLFLPLGIDEAYYILYGRYFDWHYYDHPLMTGLVLKLFTKLVPYKHEMIYRMPFMISSAICTFLVFKTGKILRGALTGYFAAIFFSASVYMSVIAGFFTMPDGMLMLFWTLAIYCAIRVFFVNISETSVKNEFMIGFGIATGLAIASKLQAIFLWIGFASYAMIFDRDIFTKKYFWISLLLSSLGCIPMFIWNANNEWVHFTFYSNRVGADPILSVSYFIREISGEIFYQNPLVFVGIIYFGFFKFKWKTDKKIGIFLLMFSMPLLLFIWSISFFKETLPHWSGPAFLTLIFLASLSLANFHFEGKRASFHLYAFGFLLLILILGTSFINFYPGTFGKKDFAKRYGQSDFTLDMYGWNRSGRNIAERLKAKGLDSLPIYADNWFPASHVDEYLRKYTANQVYGVGDLRRIHEYQWINQKRGGIPNSDSVLYISVSNYPSDPKEFYGNIFKYINCIDSVPEFRSGKLTRYFHLYLMSGKTRN